MKSRGIQTAAAALYVLALWAFVLLLVSCRPPDIPTEASGLIQCYYKGHAAFSEPLRLTLEGNVPEHPVIASYLERPLAFTNDCEDTDENTGPDRFCLIQWRKPDAGVDAGD